MSSVKPTRRSNSAVTSEMIWYMSDVTPGIWNTEITSLTDRPMASEISTILNPPSSFSRILAFRSGSADFATPINTCALVAMRVARKLIAQLMNRSSPMPGRMIEIGQLYPGLPCQTSGVNGQPLGSAQKGMGHCAAMNMDCGTPVSSTSSCSIASGMFNGKSIPSATTM